MIYLLIIKTIIICFYFSLNQEMNLKKFIFLLLMGDILTLLFIKTNFLKLVIASLLVVLVYNLFTKYNKLTKEYIIIQNGKLNFQSLLNSKYSINDIVTKIKNLGLNVEEVNSLVVRNNRVFINKYEYPYTLIIKGVVNYSNLFKVNKNKLWLDNFLKSRRCVLCFLLRKSNIFNYKIGDIW